MESLTHLQEDVLADLLQSLRLHSTLYCRATMSAPWGFGVPPRSVASFHLVKGVQALFWHGTRNLSARKAQTDH